MSSEEFVKIDGGMLEGGGQILRMSMSFSALLGIPIEVNNIRAKRSTPGLRPQHLKGLEIIRDMCNGSLKGAEVGSTEIQFVPGSLNGGSIRVDTGTAGSVCLLIQVALPCALFAKKAVELRLIGGTNAAFAPPIDYMIEVFRPLLKRFGATFEADIIRRGYYPQGGGEVHVKVSPIQELTPVTLEDPGDLKKIWGWSYVAGALPIRLSHIMADSASRFLQGQFRGIPFNVERYKERPEAAVGSGSGIVLVAETTTGCILGSSALGRRDLPAEKVGMQAAEEMTQAVQQNGGCVDSYAQDQLVIFMALANGHSRVRSGPLTLHTKTAIYIAELLTKAKFNIIEMDSDSTIIECQGISLRNKNQ